MDGEMTTEQFLNFLKKQENVQDLDNNTLVNQFGNFCLFMSYFQGEEKEALMRLVTAYQAEIERRMEER